MDKYNLYKSGIRFLKVSLVNIEVKIGFINFLF
jgi:hypothetical protein